MGEQRRHLRVQLNLPARLRWLGPLGFFVEVANTLDVCRGGLLFFRSEPCGLNAPVWVTFPYHADSPGHPAESPAKVARVRQTSSGGYLVGIAFESRQPPQPAEANRRSTERVPLAVPIRVRGRMSPWPEETMSQDLSTGGLRFHTSRVYAPGETVQVAIPYGAWSRSGEMAGRVVRADPVPETTQFRVAVELAIPKTPV